MEQLINDGQFIVLAKGNWKWITSETNKKYTYRDDETVGTVDIQISKWCNKQFISIDKFSVDVFPGQIPTGAESFHIPDYLGAGVQKRDITTVIHPIFNTFVVTGNRFCFVYAIEKRRAQYKYQFVVYDIDEENKKVSVKSQFLIDIKRPPTAIMAIKDKVFLGFPDQVGYVDLTQPSLSLNLFHNWNTESIVDAFAYDSTLPNSELIAIDDMIWPKYAISYKVNQYEPKCNGKFDLPTGVNESYRDAIKTGNRLALTAYSYNQGGEGNKIVVFEDTRAVISMEEFSSWECSYKLLYAGTEFTQLSSLGLLDNNVILVTAGTRGVIAIPIDQIKVEEKLMGYDVRSVDVPYGVKTLNIGTSASELVTVKEKSTAFVLGTTDDKHSVLSQVKWNVQTSDLEVVHNHNVEGSYDRLFMEN